MAFKLPVFIVFAMAIGFGLHDGAFAQCVQKRLQEAICKGLSNLTGLSHVKQLKNCLQMQDECKTASISKTCKGGHRKLIPGFKLLKINTTLTIKENVEAVMRSLINYINYDKNIGEHYENKKCHKSAAYKNVRAQLNRILNLVTKTKNWLGITSSLSGSLPPKFNSTKITTKTCWCDVQIQVLNKLDADLSHMDNFFSIPDPLMDKTCIIPVCTI